MRLTLIQSACLIAFTAALASAQTTIPFTLVVTQAGLSTTVPNNATLVFDVGIGSQETADIKAVYTGASQATVPQIPQVLGSTAFSVTIDGTLPLVLNPGNSLTMHVTFRPASGTPTNAQLTLGFTQTSGTTATPGTISFLLQGNAPQFTLSYVLQIDQNTVPLSPGGTIAFNPTQVNSTAQAALNITNTGSGPGQVAGVALTSGKAFKLQLLPLFPVTIQAGQTLQLLVLYEPTAVQNDSGQIQITYQGGSTATINLQGSGTSSAFSYNLIQGGKKTPIQPNGTITLPDTNVGETNSLIVQVQNTGNATGAINSISISGQAFQLTSLPLFPVTLKPNDSFSFSITFTPAQAGNLQGQLAVGGDLFTLSGQGLGPKLVFSYISSAGTIVLPAAGGAVVFTAIPIGQSEKITFVVKNVGTLDATVSNIGIGQTNSPFSVSGLPALPLSLNPGQSSQFTIAFTPFTTGFSNGTVILDTNSVALIGSGTPPPPLPSYTFQGPSGNVSPLTQSAVSLTLASGYPVALTGTLTLTTAGNLGTDPNVQFSSGGRTVPFVIPANSTNPDFAGLGPQILVQTGTVTETVTLTPSFATQAGNVDITPLSPTTLQFSVQAAAPSIVNLLVTGQSASSFTINVIGYSTTRTLNGLNLTFTAASGFNVPSAQFSIDLHQIAAAWFESSASQAFGGQFEIAIPFTLLGTPPTGKTLLQSLASVAATVSNDTGTSSSFQANVE